MPILAALLMTCWAASAAAAEPADQLKDLQAQRQKLSAELEKLQDQLHPIRETLLKGDDLADLKKAADDAEKAYEDKMKADPEILQADKALKAASDARTQAIAAAAAEDQTVVALKAGLEIAAKKKAEAQQAEAQAQTALRDIRRRIVNSPAVAEAAKKVADLERTCYELPRTAPSMAAANKALRDATEALNAKVKTLPEYQAMVAAQRAYEKALETAPEILAAKKQRDEARAAFDAKVEAAIAADPEGAAQLAKASQAEKTVEESRARVNEIEAKIHSAERDAGAKDPRVAEATKAYYAAYEARSKVVGKQAGAERKAHEDTQAALSKKVKDKLESDPQVSALIKEIKAKQAELETLSEQIRKLRKPGAGQ
jgi:hypothetical protein